MKQIIQQLEKFILITRRALRLLAVGSAKSIAAYADFARPVKTGIHIAACAAFLWIVIGREGNTPAKSNGIPMSSVVAESTVQAVDGTAREDAARRALAEARRAEEAEIAKANRIHAEQQRRLVAEQIQARREQEAYLEQARYLQQLEAQQRDAAQRHQYEAQQSASEQANREMQRYRMQMNGRPGF